MGKIAAGLSPISSKVGIGAAQEVYPEESETLSKRRTIQYDGRIINVPKLALEDRRCLEPGFYLNVPSALSLDLSLLMGR